MNLIRATLAGLFIIVPLLQAQAPAPRAPLVKPTQERPIELADLSRIIGLADPQISPDGRGVAVLVSRTNEKDNRQDRELAWVDSKSGAMRILVKGRKGLAHERWSPSGDRLAFLAEADGKSQIFVLPMVGGEAQQVSHSATGVQHFSWSPDGTRMAYGAEDEAPKIPDAQKGEDGFEVGNDDLFSNEAARPVRPTPPRPFVPQPQPLPVIDPTPAQIGPRMPWWLKLWKGLVEPWYDEAPAVPAKPDDKCGCVA